MLDLSIIHIQQQEGNGDSSSTTNNGQEGEEASESNSIVQQDINDLEPNINNLAQNDISMILADQSDYQGDPSEDTGVLQKELVFAQK